MALSWMGLYWPASEHYFQAQKFVDTSCLEEVHLAKTPKAAARLGRRRDWPLRPDWEQVKDDVTRRFQGTSCLLYH